MRASRASSRRCAAKATCWRRRWSAWHDARGMIRFLPESLLGRTLLVLAAGLLVAQLGSAVIHLFHRGGSVYRLATLQIASQIGQSARILNRLPASERHKVVQESSGPHV